MDIPNPGIKPGLLHWRLSIWAIHFLFDHFQFTLIHGPNISGSYAILFSTALDFTSITSHIHNWGLFLLWLRVFILCGAISLFFCSSILGTYRPGEFIFQCRIFCLFILVTGFSGLPRWPSDKKNPPANAGGARDSGSIPGSRRSPGEGNSNALQCSCLENSMDREPGGLHSMGSQRVKHNWVTKCIHGVLKTRMLKWFSIPFSRGPCLVRTLHHLGGPYIVSLHSWFIVSLS